MSERTVHVTAYADGQIVAERQERGVTVLAAINLVRASLGAREPRDIGYSYRVYEDCPHCDGEGLVPI